MLKGVRRCSKFRLIIERNVEPERLLYESLFLVGTNNGVDP